MEWRIRAACRTEDPELFFPTGAAGPESERQSQQAKEVCGRCMVRLDCLEYAVLNGETEGIWGGMTPSERLRIRDANRHRLTLLRSPSKVG